jgi:acylphosphatase
MVMVRKQIFVFGRVQGVFFRDHTQRWASSLGLTGWVRNLIDGRVELLVEGEEDKVQMLIAKLKQGPPMAIVDNLDITSLDYAGEFFDFRITW